MNGHGSAGDIVQDRQQDASAQSLGCQPGRQLRQAAACRAGQQQRIAVSQFMAGANFLQNSFSLFIF